MIAIMVIHFATLCSLFLAASFGHWQAGYVVALVWVSAYAIAAWYLYGREEPGAGVLAATWALVAAETAFYDLILDYGEGPVNLVLYTMVEVIDDTVIPRYFADDSGNIYEGDGRAASVAKGTPEPPE